MKPAKKLAQNLIVAVLALIILSLILEISLRIHHRLRHGISFFKRIDEAIADPQLGWRGKRIWGDLSTKKFKIFIVGDSYTEGCCGLKEEELYYNVIKNKLEVELFIYGAGGYGTLQEYLIIDRFIDQIKPDLVLLQVCSNDFIDNVWLLESASFINCHYMVKPYYENGRIEYRYPRGPILLRRYLTFYSRLVYLILERIDMFLAELAKRRIIQTVEFKIEGGADLEQFRQSVLVTSELLEKIKSRCGRDLLIAFLVNDIEPYFSRFKLMFKKFGIEFVEEIPRVIRNAEMQGNKLRLPDGGHWNKDGNRICGEYLAKYIKSHILTRASNN